MQRGRLNGTKDAIQSGTLAFEQAWGLDPVGNWGGFEQDDDGDGTFDLVQQRANNKVNEITDITETAGPSWVTPGYDLAGNTTILPQPSDPTKQYEATYDAWNRLVRLWDPSIGTSGGKVAEYEYDARGFRIRRREYDPATGAYQRSFDDYYTNQWKLIETRVTTSPTAIATDLYEQYVWHACADAYVDQLLLRRRDTDGDGTLDEHLYALQDTHSNVVAVVDEDSGNVLERCDYAPYGERLLLQPNYDMIIGGVSAYDWRVGHHGLLYDVESGMIYNRARMLNTCLGMFLQRDPWMIVPRLPNPGDGYRDGMSLYQAYQSNPLLHRDPAGEALFATAILTAGIAKGSYHLILGMYYARLCSRCIDQVVSSNNRTLHNAGRVSTPQNPRAMNLAVQMVNRSNALAVCQPLCSKAYTESLKGAKWLIFSVGCKFVIKMHRVLIPV
jgi:RHS repeat-associated protein